MNQNVLLLSGAAACGVIAMLLAFVYLSQQETHAGPEPTVELLVAARDVPAGTTLDPRRDLTTLEVPARLQRLSSLGIAPDYLASLEGRQVNRPIGQGTPLMYADFVPIADFDLEEGDMALSVPVSGADALGGLLVPGDFVKLFVTRPLPPKPTEASPPPSGASPEQLFGQLFAEQLRRDETEQWQAEAIASEPLQVLAVGRHLAGSRQQMQSAAGGGGAAPMRYDSVTLKVTEEQAQRILERTSGSRQRLTLVLAAPGNSQTPRHVVPDF